MDPLLGDWTLGNWSFFLKNNIMKIKLILTVAAVIAAAVIIGGGYWYWQDKKEAAFLSGDPRTGEAYAIIQKREAQLKKDKYNYDALMSLAFNWKGIGEILNNEKYLRRSVAVYNKIIGRYSLKAYLPFLNRANVYISLREYGRAESDLKIASEIDPGEQNLYIALADLYKGYLKKSDKEIRAVYESGIRTVVGGGNLVASYAAYLRETGDNKLALKFYQSLAKAYPENDVYKIMIKELEQIK